MSFSARSSDAKSFRCIFVVGPTGVGKSAFAMKWARAKNGFILNADSIQTYKELTIGAAKPTSEDMSRVPHFLFGEMDLHAKLSAGDYRTRALEILNEQKNYFPYAFIVGGSGFYIKALTEGMFLVPKVKPEISRHFRQRLQNEGAKKLWEEMVARDSHLKARIHPNDQYRIVRALEVMEQTRQPLSLIRAEFAQARKGSNPFPYPFLKLGLRLQREKLRARIQDRTAFMMSAGLIEETDALIRKYGEDIPPLASVGYKETVLFLKGELATKSELLEAIIKSTMALAKRQMTWFQKDKDVQWYDADQIQPEEVSL